WVSIIATPCASSASRGSGSSSGNVDSTGGVVAARSGGGSSGTGWEAEPLQAASSTSSGTNRSRWITEAKHSASRVLFEPGNQPPGGYVHRKAANSPR